MNYYKITEQRRALSYDLHMSMPNNIGHKKVKIIPSKSLHDQLSSNSWANDNQIRVLNNHQLIFLVIDAVDVIISTTEEFSLLTRILDRKYPQNLHEKINLSW